MTGIAMEPLEALTLASFILAAGIWSLVGLVLLYHLA